jgi:hypothetical protein
MPYIRIESHVGHIFLQFHFYGVQFKKEGEISGSTLRYKVTVSVISFLLMAHFLACLFYFLSPCYCPRSAEEDCLYPLPGSPITCKPETWTYQLIIDRKFDSKNRDFFKIWKW